MVYDGDLAERLHEVLAPEAGVSHRRMFGGLAFMIDGHMAVGASQHDGLMLRVDPADADTLLADPHAAPFVMRGRELRGWLRIAPAGVTADDDLRRWVTVGITYARSLPAK